MYSVAKFAGIPLDRIGEISNVEFEKIAEFAEWQQTYEAQLRAALQAR